MPGDHLPASSAAYGKVAGVMLSYGVVIVA